MNQHIEDTCVEYLDTILVDENCQEANIKVPNMSDCRDPLKI